MRAARALAGLSIPELSAELVKRGKWRGLKPTILYQIEQGKREGTQPEELRLIAEACGVPFSWFAADFSRLDEVAADDPLSEVARRISAAYQRSEERRGGRRGSPPPPLAEEH